MAVPVCGQGSVFEYSTDGTTFTVIPAVTAMGISIGQVSMLDISNNASNGLTEQKPMKRGAHTMTATIQLDPDDATHNTIMAQVNNSGICAAAATIWRMTMPNAGGATWKLSGWPNGEISQSHDNIWMMNLTLNGTGALTYTQ